MEKRTLSNYQKLCNDWAEKFLRMDTEELKRRLPELKEEEDHFENRTFRSEIWNQGKQMAGLICLDKRRRSQILQRC